MTETTVHARAACCDRCGQELNKEAARLEFSKPFARPGRPAGALWVCTACEEELQVFWYGGIERAANKAA